MSSRMWIEKDFAEVGLVLCKDFSPRSNLRPYSGDLISFDWQERTQILQFLPWSSVLSVENSLLYY